ncbi:MAG TPA: PPC domain-containing protein, partial [Allocoleopsis sp.]
MVKDAGDKLSTALDVKFKGNKVTVKNSFGKTDRLDFYKVRVTGRSSLSCFLSGLQSDADLAIFDEDLNRLASSRNDDDSSETVQTQLDKGIYFIRVNQISGKSDYNLKFSLSGDAGDRYTKSYKVPPGQLKKGKFVYDDFIGKNGDKFDYYQIKLDGPSNLSLFLNG